LAAKKNEAQKHLHETAHKTETYCNTIDFLIQEIGFVLVEVNVLVLVHVHVIEPAFDVFIGAATVVIPI
jgi:hypothetical protein